MWIFNSVTFGSSHETCARRRRHESDILVWRHVTRFGQVCSFWLCIILKGWNTSAEHETKRLYKYETFLLLLFYNQCYGINTVIDKLYEYKWWLLFHFWPDTACKWCFLSWQTGLCFLFHYSILTITNGPDLHNTKTTEAPSGQECFLFFKKNLSPPCLIWRGVAQH